MLLIIARLTTTGIWCIPKRSFIPFQWDSLRALIYAADVSWWLLVVTARAGIDRLIEAKLEDLKRIDWSYDRSTHPTSRRKWPNESKALKEMKIMGEYYGLDLQPPGANLAEAVQWVYMKHLAAVKNRMELQCHWVTYHLSLIFIANTDLAHGNIDWTFAQELIVWIRYQTTCMVRHLRMQSYNDIFARPNLGETSESIGGRFNDGRTKVTRLLSVSANTIQPGSIRNLIWLYWDPDLPEGFKGILCKSFYRHLLRTVRKWWPDAWSTPVEPIYGGPPAYYLIQEMESRYGFFGARNNLLKNSVTLAINGGRCENTGTVVVKRYPCADNCRCTKFEEEVIVTIKGADWKLPACTMMQWISFIYAR